MILICNTFVTSIPIIMIKKSSIWIFLLLAQPLWANQPIDHWGPAAIEICNQIDSAVQFYEKGDIKNARKQAIMAYFSGYDAEIEPAVRVTVGASHVFEMEHKFRNFTRHFTLNPDEKHFAFVKNSASELCRAVKDDAKTLNEAKVDKQVFKVN